MGLTMAEAVRYSWEFGETPFAVEQLDAEVRALNIAEFKGACVSGTLVELLFDTPLTNQQLVTVGQVIAAHVPSDQFAKQLAVQSAVAGLLLSADPATQALLKILEVQQTRANDLAELLAKVLSWAKVQPDFPLWVGREAEYAAALAATPRLTESAIQAKVVQMMLATDAPPNPPPLAPGGG